MKSLSATLRDLSVAAFAIFTFVRGAAAPTWHVSHYESVLGTSLELRFAVSDPARAAAAESAALAEIDRLGKILSGYDETSEFRRWLGTQGEPSRVSPELFAVLALFDTWRDRTGGALDASAEVAGRLWKNAAREQRVPSAGELAAAVAAVRQPHWRLDAAARTATHLSAAPLMLNSFAKSYIIDRACTAALAVGPLEAAVVNLGGDIVTRGTLTIVVGIADPLADGEGDELVANIAVRDRAVATSGGYRRGVEIAGRWYSHLVDPRTGRPVDHVRSATVVSPRGTDAGALATALCVMAPEEGLRLAATVPDTECFLLLADGSRVSSRGWQKNEVPRFDVRAALAPINPSVAGADNAAERWDSTYELAVNFEIATQLMGAPGPGGGESGKGSKGGKGGRGGRGGAKRPFVAIWIEDQDHFPVRTVALWYHGERWLPELRSWTHADQVREKTEGAHLTTTVSSATRSPGKYSVKWDGLDAAGSPVRRGKYTVFLEIAREHGTHHVLKWELDLAAGPARHEFPANPELTTASFDYRRRTSAH